MARTVKTTASISLAYTADFEEAGDTIGTAPLDIVRKATERALEDLLTDAIKRDFVSDFTVAAMVTFDPVE